MKNEIPTSNRPIKPFVDFIKESNEMRKPMTESGVATVDGMVMASWQCANQSLSYCISDLIRDFYTCKL